MKLNENEFYHLIRASAHQTEDVNKRIELQAYKNTEYMPIGISNAFNKDKSELPDIWEYLKKSSFEEEKIKEPQETDTEIIDLFAGMGIKSKKRR